MLAVLLQCFTEAAAAEESEVVSLLGLRGKLSALRAGLVDPRSAGWFGAFVEDESTFNEDAVAARHEENKAKLLVEGWEPDGHEQIDLSHVRDSGFFDESPSGGSLVAWQTHPSVGDDAAGNQNLVLSPWRQSPEGWVQDWASVPDHGRGEPGANGAAWFDSSVQNYDGFGRFMRPLESSERRLLGWEERTRNTTLRCATPGCSAEASLQVFDVANEEARHCRLSIMVRPTDFDDDYSREVVEDITGNDVLLKHNCNPRARGCNDTARQNLYGCVLGLDADDLLRSTGKLDLRANISENVDECPFEGDLLHAVALINCLVVRKTTTTTTTTTTPTTTPWPLHDLMGRSALRCREQGCNASTVLEFDATQALLGGRCVFSMNVTQTDFDRENVAKEVIEYVTVENHSMAIDVQPNANPCLDAMRGNKSVANKSERNFVLFSNVDITEQVLRAPYHGRLEVKGKISHAVDECGTPDLFDATVQIVCHPPAQGAIPLDAGANAAA